MQLFKQFLNLYGALWLLGLVTLGLAVLRWGAENRLRGCLNLIGVLTMGVVVAFVLLTFSGPLVGAAIGIMNTNCPPETLADGQIRYVCYVTSSPTYTLEGRSGLPFVRLVSFGGMNNS